MTRAMTVRELAAALLALPDQDAPVHYYDGEWSKGRPAVALQSGVLLRANNDFARFYGDEEDAEELARATKTVVLVAPDNDCPNCTPWDGEHDPSTCPRAGL